MLNAAKSKIFSTEDQRWMRRALKVAEQSLFISSPNPRVGCVLVRDGRWLAEGFTQVAGGAHAEAKAIASAIEQGIDLVGATAYVSLEPCSHHGRTAPCSTALIKAGIKRVVIAMQDPNPKVSGQGIQALRAAGIEVDAGLFAADALALNPGFCARMLRNTPWVRLKSAASLDGHTALNDGSSQWITGQQARLDGHRWRAQACVVLTGIGTVLADNPRLNVRTINTARQPLRAVLDPNFEIPEDAHIFDGNPVLIFAADVEAGKVSRLAERNVRTINIPTADTGMFDLPALVRWLGEHEVNEVHVEAGARLLGSFVSAGLVDEWVAYVAPSVIGSGRGLAQLLPEVDSLEQVPRYEFLDVQQIGADVRLHLRNPQSWQFLLDSCFGTD